MDYTIWDIGGFALWWIVPFLTLYALAGYYDLFRAKLVPNVFSTLALIIIVLGKSVEGGWNLSTLVLAGIILVMGVGLAAFTGGRFGWGDTKWMFLTALALGPVAYFAITAGILIGIVMAVPLILLVKSQGIHWRKTPLPLVVALFAGTILVMIYQGYLDRPLELGVIAFGSLALILYGVWEKRNKPLPTWEWLYSQDPQAQRWEISKGLATSDNHKRFEWSKDRHRILLHDLFTPEAQLAVWEGKTWHGPAAMQGWKMDIKPAPKRWGIYRPAHSSHILLHTVSADDAAHTSK